MDSLEYKRTVWVWRENRSWRLVVRLSERDLNGSVWCLRRRWRVNCATTRVWFYYSGRTKVRTSETSRSVPNFRTETLRTHWDSFIQCPLTEEYPFPTIIVPERVPRQHSGVPLRETPYSVGARTPYERRDDTSVHGRASPSFLTRRPSWHVTLFSGLRGSYPRAQCSVLSL